MSREELIASTLNKINQLPDDRVEEISDFADKLLRKIDDHLLNKGMENINDSSESFSFLQTEDDIYTVNDLKETYQSGKG